MLSVFQQKQKQKQKRQDSEFKSENQALKK